MLIDLLTGNFDKVDLMLLLMRIPIILIALSFHEMSHGYVAEKLGDNTARWNGRITMNPIKHFDLIGTLSMLFLGIGWAKPVPINTRNFKNPKKGMAITGLAGPVANLILGFLGAILLHLSDLIFSFTSDNQSLINLGFIIYLFLYTFMYLNIYLAVFNLLPIPPFDGSRIFYSILPTKWYFAVMKYERAIMIAIIFLAFSGTLSLPIEFIADKIMWFFDFVVGLVPGL